MSMQLIANRYIPDRSSWRRWCSIVSAAGCADLHIVQRPSGLVRGRAATYHAKQLAQHIAMELTPLPILSNDIEVR